jgi:hypothetical protein
LGGTLLGPPNRCDNPVIAHFDRLLVDRLLDTACAPTWLARFPGVISEKIMSVFEQRSRIITLRVSPNEYAAIEEACGRGQARSVAEFARSAILQKVSSVAPGPGLLTNDLTSLSSRLRELDSALDDMRKQVVKVLGSVSS